MICDEENLFVQDEDKTQLTKDKLLRIKNQKI